MNRVMILVVMALVAAPLTTVLGHEGHEHKLLGTVSMVHENHLEVKATDGKLTVVTVNEKTRIVRGSATVKITSLKAGERVVVTAIETKGKDGRAVLVAKEVRLAAGTQAAK